MNFSMKMKWIFSITPLFFSLFPIMDLLANNPGKINPASLVSSISIVLLISIGLLLISLASFRKFDISIIVAALSSFAIFMFGYFDTFATNLAMTEKLASNWRMFLWLLVFAVICLVVIRLPQIWRPTRDFLFFFGIILCLPTVLNLRQQDFISNSGQESFDAMVFSPQKGTPIQSSVDPTVRRDIYYIILDGYGRADMLDAYYGFDNSDFMNFLEEKGFYIAPFSQSNYAQTRLSLPSSLNMDYLDRILSADPNNSDYYSWLRVTWENNTVMSTARELGYTTIFFDNGMNFSKNTRAEIVHRYSWFDDYYALLLDRTILRPFRIDFEIAEFRQVLGQSLREVEDIPDLSEPTFAFLHILYPHPPFIFDRNGDFPEFENARENFKHISWYPKSAYIDQLVYINAVTQQLVTSILENSEIPPIIIIQSDHGPGRQEPIGRLPILNAYFLPGGGSDLLYSSISPVNTFRLIFDYYFVSGFGLLEDHSWFSSYENEFEFCNVDAFPYLEKQNQTDWFEKTAGLLVEHDWQIEISLPECEFGMFFAPDDNFRGYELSPFKNQDGFRWAGESIRFRLPILEQGRDYRLSALVRKTPPVSEPGTIELILEGKALNEVTISDTTDIQAIEFVFPASMIGESSVVFPTIRHNFSAFDHGHGEISLRYYGLEWRPVLPDQP